jgi:hypothetical protein
MPVISELDARESYDTYPDRHSSAKFQVLAAVSHITRRTAPMVRGTRTLSGSLVPVRNHYLFGA